VASKTQYTVLLENYDLPLKYDARIGGESYLKIWFDLLALPEVRHEESKGYSLSWRCSLRGLFTKTSEMVRIETDDTAGSASFSRKKGLTYAAAISSILSAGYMIYAYWRRISAMIKTTIPAFYLSRTGSSIPKRRIKPVS
jgi:prephenate dehydratase